MPITPPKEPDRISIDGMELPLLNNPLEAYFQTTRTSSPFRDLPTDASDSRPLRGHVATWSLENGHLYLTRVITRTARQTPGAGEPEIGELLNRFGIGDYYERSIDLAELFPGCLPPIEARWYSGTLRVGRGNVLQYDHRAYNTVYEQVEEVEVRAGWVLSHRLLDGFDILRGRAEAEAREPIPMLWKAGLVVAAALLALMILNIVLSASDGSRIYWMFYALLFPVGLVLSVSTWMLLGSFLVYWDARRSALRYARSQREVSGG